MTARIVAAFDVDGTLTRRDSLLPFLTGLVGRRRVATALARAAFGPPGRDAAKERLLVGLLRDRPFTEVATAGREYGNRLAATGITEPMRHRLAWHRTEGHEVVLVSASLACYLEPAAEALGIATVLSTRLAVDAAGQCTGRLEGGNCRGPEKAHRLRTHLGSGPVELWAYGDSRGDDAMLALADHAVRVRRGVPSVKPR
ncbi:MAG: HAD-IB family hydrolase [Actinomycetota bacterium]